MVGLQLTAERLNTLTILFQAAHSTTVQPTRILVSEQAERWVWSSLDHASETPSPAAPGSPVLHATPQLMYYLLNRQIPDANQALRLCWTISCNAIAIMQLNSGTNFTYFRQLLA